MKDCISEISGDAGSEIRVARVLKTEAVRAETTSQCHLNTKSHCQISSRINHQYPFIKVFLLVLLTYLG